MKSISLVVIGNSHLQDLEEAYINCDKNKLYSVHTSNFVRLYENRYNPMVSIVDGNTLFNQELERDILDLIEKVKSDALITSILGSEHLIWSVQGQERPFDVILPFAPELPRIPDTELIPFGALYSLVKEGIGPYLRFNKRLSDITSLPVFQLLPPLPVGSQDIILETAPETLKSMLLENGVPSPIIRYKMWRLWIHVAEEIAAELGVSIIPMPEEAKDENGLLKRQYARDSVHANASLGLLTWREINAFFS